LRDMGVRITAEWRGAEPTSGLGVVLDLYKPIPKPEPWLSLLSTSAVSLGGVIRYIATFALSVKNQFR
jgi:hypothetical protein